MIQKKKKNLSDHLSTTSYFTYYLLSGDEQKRIKDIDSTRVAI